MESATRWTARPVYAAVLRSLVFLGPLALSTAVVFAALAILPLEGASTPALVASWVALGVVAALVMVVGDRLARRLLPVAALMRLSLVMPDDMPSRFATASGRLTPEELAEEVARARAGSPGETPAEAASRLLRLVAQLAEHDALTRGHSDRVRAYSQIIGQSLGLSEDDLDRLNWAALLHDVGKMAVPREVLNKRGRPSDEEWEMLKAHAVEGARMAAPLSDWLGEWFPAIAEHHERWDGTGYPEGLAGEEISLAGRIVAAADAYDVMTSDRTYSSACSRADALAELTACSGSHFDPAVVRAMLDASAGLPRVAYSSGAMFGPLPILGRLASLPSVAPSTASSVLASAAIVGAGTLAPATLSAAASLVAPPPPATAPAADTVAESSGFLAPPPGGQTDTDTPAGPPGGTGREPETRWEGIPAGEPAPASPSPPVSGGGGTPPEQGGGGGADPEDPPDGGGPDDPDPEPEPPVVEVPPVVDEIVEIVEPVAPPVVEEVVETVEPVVEEVVEVVVPAVPDEVVPPPPVVPELPEVGLPGG